MSTTQHYRPFTAATDKFAYAQAFSRSDLAHRDLAPSGRSTHRRLRLALHRRPARDLVAR